MWAFGGSSSNVNVAAGINNYMPTNIGGSITSGSVGNASIFQDGSSSATGGTNSLGIKVQGMPGLMELDALFDSCKGANGMLDMTCYFNKINAKNQNTFNTAVANQVGTDEQKG